MDAATQCQKPLFAKSFLLPILRSSLLRLSLMPREKRSDAEQRERTHLLDNIANVSVQNDVTNVNLRQRALLSESASRAGKYCLRNRPVRISSWSDSEPMSRWPARVPASTRS